MPVVVFAAGLPVVAVLAASTDVGDPVAWLVNVGVAGIVIALLVTGQLRTKSEVTQLERQLAAKDEIIAAFATQLSGNTLPALARSAQVLEALPRATERAVYGDLHQIRHDVATLSQRLQRLADEGGDPHG